jgi:hypothetical protein
MRPTARFDPKLALSQLVGWADDIHIRASRARVTKTRQQAGDKSRGSDRMSLVMITIFVPDQVFAHRLDELR